MLIFIYCIQGHIVLQHILESVCNFNKFLKTCCNKDCYYNTLSGNVQHRFLYKKFMYMQHRLYFKT